MRLALLVIAACTPHVADPPPATVRPAVAPGARGARAAPAPDAPTRAAAPDARAAPDASPACIDDGAPYDPAALRARVATLAAPALDGRAPGSAGDSAARAYLVERFRCLGLTPGGVDGSYEQPFDAAGHATANLIGYLAGDDPAVGDDIVLVGAHHDHLGDGHLGANDNASGAVALLALAQALHQAPHRRTIAFVLFGGEELGLLGSQAFAAAPPAALPLARVVYDVNLDMVGSYASAGAVYAMGTFRGLPATAIVRTLQRAHPALHVGVGGRGVGSDHEAFCAAGIPYVFFWTPDKRCYHARCDTVEQLDVAHLAGIAALAGALVEQLAASPLDLAASRTRRGCGNEVISVRRREQRVDRDRHAGQLGRAQRAAAVEHARRHPGPRDVHRLVARVDQPDLRRVPVPDVDDEFVVGQRADHDDDGERVVALDVDLGVRGRLGVEHVLPRRRADRERWRDLGREPHAQPGDRWPAAAHDLGGSSQSTNASPLIRDRISIAAAAPSPALMIAWLVPGRAERPTM